MNLHFVDLIGTPYESGAKDCLWTAKRALERIFEDFDQVELPGTAEEEEAALAAVDSNATRWSVIGSTAALATEQGDLIHLRLPDGHAGLVVVIDRVGRIGITSTRDRGVHTIPLRRLAGVVAVLRRRA